MPTHSFVSSLPAVRLLAAGCALAAVALAAGFWPYQVDDAFIFYRYVDHLTSGVGLAYNAGGPWIEGFTSPAWLAALTALAAIAGRDALPAAGFALGIVCLVATLAAAWRIQTAACTDDPAATRWAGLVSLALLTLCPAIPYYAASGMDALLFVVVVVAFAGAAAGRLPIAVGVAAGLVALWTRPEGGWLPVMLIAQRWPTIRREARESTLLVGSVIVGGAALVTTRWLVFGDFFPNTYYAKQPSFGAGLDYLGQTLSTPWGATLLAAAALGAALGRPIHRGFALAGGSWLLAAALEGGDWMRLGRLLLPAFALFALAGGGIAIGLAERRARSDVASRGLRWVATGLAIGLLAIGLSTTRIEQRVAHTTLATLRAEEQQIAAWLGQAGVGSAALVDIGLVGFATRLEIVDLGGLTDRTIAHAPGGHIDKQFDLAYVFDDRRPDVVVIRLRTAPTAGPAGLPQTRPLDAESSVEARLLADPRLARDYHFAVALLPGYPRSLYYGRLLFVRKGFAALGGDTTPLSVGAEGPIVLYSAAPDLSVGTPAPR